jgi:hypothetical protein
VSDEPAIVAGAVEPAIARELPGLGLVWCAFAVDADPLRRSPPELRERLRRLSDRQRGATALALRSRAIPHAYRVLSRHLGIEPDIDRIPVEALAVERMLAGVHPSRGLLADALAVATVETEVGVWAADAERVGEPRLAQEDGRVVVAGVAPLFAEPAGAAAVTRETRRLALYAVRAPGVPDIALSEALWVAWELIA